MFCNQCGTELPLGFATCHRCGRRIGDAMAQSRLDRHLHTLGFLWMLAGGLFLIPALALMLFGSSAHFVVHDCQLWPGIVPLLAYLAGSTLAILAAGGVCVGLGLREHRSWARTTAIIFGVLALFHPPFGTALGIYTLWVLLSSERADEYRCLSRTT